MEVKNECELNYNELEFAITFAYKTNKTIQGDYKRLAEVITEQSGKNVTEFHIWKHFEPEIEDFELEERKHLNNIRHGYTH